MAVLKKSHGHNFWNFYESSRQIQENIFFLDLTRGFVKIPKIVAVFFFTPLRLGFFLEF